MFSQTLNVARKYGPKVLAGAALVPVMIGSAFAEVPTEVSTALAEAKTDSVSVAGIVIGIIVAIAAFAFMRKAIR